MRIRFELLAAIALLAMPIPAAAQVGGVCPRFAAGSTVLYQSVRTMLHRELTVL